MKRSVCSILTAAAVVGCQSPGANTVHNTPMGVGHSAKATPPAGMPLPGSRMAAKTEAPKSDVVQVGYNTGYGTMNSMNFGRQRVAAALPSHGGHPPGQFAGGGMGGMPPMMGGPGAPGMGAPGLPGVPLGPRFVTGRTQIRFVGPVDMKVGWQSADPTGTAVAFTGPQLTAPDRYNFLQAQIYRLKLSGIAGREGVELYPTLEVYPGNAKVDAYLAHNAVPVEFTPDDFDQVAGGNFVTKVIYLPDAKYQELALFGVETLVSTRLDPGVNPVEEAHKRGSILAVIRIGSVDLEMANAPALLPTAAPIPPALMMPPGMMGGMPGGPVMAPPPGTPIPGKATIVSPKPIVPPEAK